MIDHFSIPNKKTRICQIAEDAFNKFPNKPKNLMFHSDPGETDGIKHYKAFYISRLKGFFSAVETWIQLNDLLNVSKMDVYTSEAVPLAIAIEQAITSYGKTGEQKEK